MKVVLYRILPLLALVIFLFPYYLIGNNFLLIGLALTIPFIASSMKQFLSDKFIGKFFFLIIIASILNLFVTQNGIGGTINFIVAIFLAYFCVKNLKVTAFCVLFACLILSIYLYQLLFIQGIDPRFVFESVNLSKNYPGFLLVLFVIYWGIAKYHMYGTLPLLLPLVGLSLCFMLDGRSSLGVMAGICMICVFFRGAGKRVFLSILVGIVVLLGYSSDILFYYSESNLEASGLESSRIQIWNSYLEALDPMSLLLGLDTLTIPIMRQYGGNPHNAFLNFHYRMGLIGLVCLLALIAKSLKSCRERKDFRIYAFILLLLVRIFFDACIGSTQDCLIYAIFLLPIYMPQADHSNERKYSKFESFIVKYI